MLAFVTTLATSATTSPTTVEIAPGVVMPLVNLGTWSLGNGKPSDPSVGVPPWIAAGGVGIDCAWDYFNQNKVKAAVASAGVPRSSLFYTTKVPGVLPSLSTVRTDLKQLGSPKSISSYCTRRWTSKLNGRVLNKRWRRTLRARLA